MSEIVHTQTKSVATDSKKEKKTKKKYSKLMFGT